MIRNTSRESLESVRLTLGKRQRAVLAVINFCGPICNLGIAYNLSLPINSITPRTNELLELGLITEHHKAISPTGRRAIYWAVKAEKQKELFTNDR